MLLRHVLANRGIEAEIVRNGAEAIVRLKDTATDYGLVCSDVELPGASGWTILEWVHTCYPKLPIVLISGVNDGSFVREAHRRGALGAFRNCLQRQTKGGVRGAGSAHQRPAALLDQRRKCQHAIIR